MNPINKTKYQAVIYGVGKSSSEAVWCLQVCLISVQLLTFTHMLHACELLPPAHNWIFQQDDVFETPSESCKSTNTVTNFYLYFFSYEAIATK